MAINQDGKETADTDDDVLEEKLTDVEVPGFEAAFDPDEAEQLGAFEEDALSEEDAKESSMDQEG